MPAVSTEDLPPGKEIVVVPRKKNIYVTRVEGPLHVARDKDGTALYFPTKFEAYTYWADRWWLITVEFENGRPVYEAKSRDDPSVSSGPRDTPTTAIRLAMINAGLPVPQYTNGRIIFGITYPPVQKEIKERLRADPHVLIAEALLDMHRRG